MGEQPQPERRAVARLLVDRGAAGVDRDGPVLVAHRARDPGHVVVLDEAAQRGDEPAAAASRDPLAVRVAPVGDRPAIRDDDQLAAARHAPTTLRRASAASPPRPRR